MSPQTDDPTLESNAYAIAFRLLGDRPAARAVAGIAAERVRQGGGLANPSWMRDLVAFTIEQTVGPGVLSVEQHPDDDFAGFRVALRRRLERATPDERVAGALIQLAGYPPDFVAGVVHRTVEETVALAGVLAPPPGVQYRDLGDPELTGRVPRAPLRRRRVRRPHWTTVAALAFVVAIVIAATQVTGPRPTFGPPLEEGGLGAVTDVEIEPGRDAVSGTADPTPN